MNKPEPTEPELYWSRNQNAVYRVYIDAGIVILGDQFRHFGDDLPADAVRLVPENVIRHSELRKRIESTRHRYWGKGGQVNTSELTDQILSFLHDAGVAVRSDQYVGGPARPRGAAPVPDNTQETHDGH